MRDYLFSRLHRHRRLFLTLAALLFSLILLIVFMIFWLPVGGEDPPLVFQTDRSLDMQKMTQQGVVYIINNSRATFRLDVAPADWHENRLFSDYAAALRYCQIQGLPAIPSVQMVQAKCKKFDDAICAALEKAMQKGDLSLALTGKQAALTRLFTQIVSLQKEAAAEIIERATAYVGGALQLSEAIIEMKPEVRQATLQAAQNFLEDACHARPAGFWETDRELTRLFHQDRFLMRGLLGNQTKPKLWQKELATCILLSCLIVRDPQLSQTFATLHALDSSLTNPRRGISWEEVSALFPAQASLAELLQPDQVRAIGEKLRERFGDRVVFALIFYSTSKEEEIAARHIPELAAGIQTMQFILSEIKSGRISLEPKPDSGWYDYQWYALETLLLPEKAQESAKFKLTPAYQERLQNAFKTGITALRDTHIKHLPVQTLGGRGAFPIKAEIGPEFSVEPTATVYLRLARSYRFLQTALSRVLGEELLRHIRRTPTAPALDKELSDMALLLYGLYEHLCLEIGQRPKYHESELSTTASSEAREKAANWLATLSSDADFSLDTRIIVPIAYDPVTAKTSYWAIAGIRLEQVRYQYEEEPEVRTGDPVFVPTRYYLPTPIFVELEQDGALSLNSAGFRVMCDRAKDVAALQQMLGISPGRTGQPLLVVALLLRLCWVAIVVLLFTLSRRHYLCLLWATLLTLAIGSIVIGLGCYWSPTFRVQVMVKYVARINTLLAMSCERWIMDMREPEVTHALVALLQHSEPQVRYLAARYLAWPNPNTGVPGWTYGRTGFNESRVQQLLRKAAEDPLVPVAATAIVLLNRSPENWDFFLAQLKTKSQIDVMCAVLICKIGEYKSQQTTDILLPLLKDSRSLIRTQTLYALRTLGDPKSLDHIVLLFTDPSRDVRIVAQRSLRYYNDPRTIYHLIELAKSGDEKVRDRAYGMMADIFDHRPWNQEVELDLAYRLALLHYLTESALTGKLPQQGQRALDQALEEPNRQLFRSESFLQAQPRQLDIKISHDVPPPQNLPPYQISLTPVDKPKEPLAMRDGEKIAPGFYLMAINQTAYEPVSEKIIVWPADYPLLIKKSLVARPVMTKIHIAYDVQPPQDLPACRVLLLNKLGIPRYVADGESVKPGSYFLEVLRPGYSFGARKAIEILPGIEPYQINEKLIAKPRYILFVPENNGAWPEFESLKLLDPDTKEEIKIGNWPLLCSDQVREVVLQFKEFKTVSMRISMPSPGEGPFIVKIPLQPLKAYEFFGSHDLYEIDALQYPFEFYADSQPIEKHLIQIKESGKKIAYKLWVDPEAKNLAVYAGYLFAEVALKQKQLTDSRLPWLYRISIPRLIEYLERVTCFEEHACTAALNVMDRLGQTAFYRFRAAPKTEITLLLEYVKTWRATEPQDQARHKTLIEELEGLAKDGR